MRLPCAVRFFLASHFAALLTASAFMQLSAGLDDHGRRLLGGSVLASALCSLASLGWLVGSQWWEDVVEIEDPLRIIPLHVASGCLSIVMLIIGLYIFSMLSVYQADPMDAMYKGQLPICFSGHWFAAEARLAKAALCEMPADAPPHVASAERGGIGKAAVMPGANASRYFRSPHGQAFAHKDAAAHCQSRGARLALVQSALDNQAARDACGAAECWIGLQREIALGCSSSSSSRPCSGRQSEQWRWSGRAEVVAGFSNWASGEPLGLHALEPAATALNSVRLCRSGIYGRGRSLHRMLSSLRRVWELLNIGTATAAVALMHLSRQVMETRDLGELRFVEVANRAACCWACVEAVCAIAVCAMARLGYFVHSRGSGFLPGGPVLCLVDAPRFGFRSVESCEGQFSSRLALTAGAIALVRGLQVALFARGSDSARRYRCGCHREAVPTLEPRDPGDGGSSPVPVVVGVPMFGPSLTRRAPPTDAALPVVGGGAPASMSWAPAPQSADALRYARWSFGGTPAAVFEEATRNTCGTLGPLEFSRLLRNHNPNISQREIQDLWRRADADSDGRLDCTEFCALFHDGDAAP